MSQARTYRARHGFAQSTCEQVAPADVFYTPCCLPAHPLARLLDVHTLLRPSCRAPATHALRFHPTARPAGISRPAKRQPPAVPASRRGGQGGSHQGVPLHRPQPVPKRQRIDAFISHAPPPPQRQQQAQQAAGLLSLSQVDPAVLQELPAEVRREVLQQLQPGGRPHGSRALPRSRLGQQQRETEAAWQQRWQEEQQLREAETADAVGSMLVDGASQQWAGGGAALLQQEEQPQEAAVLPPAVQRFVVEAGSAASAQSLAAALAGCLEQLEAQLAADSAQQQQQQQQPEAAADTGGEGSGGGSDDAEGGSAGAVAVGGGTNGPTSSMDKDLPPTQRIAADSDDEAADDAAASGAEAAEVAGDGRHGSGGSPRAQADHAPAAAPASGELRRSLDALGAAVQRAAAALLARKDLEQLRLLLLAVARLGGEHPWFAGAAAAATEAAQGRVAARYGWRLRLPGLLQPEPG